MCDCGNNQCVCYIILQAQSEKSVKMYSVQSMYIFQVHHLHFCIHYSTYTDFLCLLLTL